MFYVKPKTKSSCSRFEMRSENERYVTFITNIRPGTRPLSLVSDQGRMFDTLLPIPDAEYPAFYPIGIKASCVCILHYTGKPKKTC
jgi:hypothetical protein